MNHLSSPEQRFKNAYLKLQDTALSLSTSLLVSCIHPNLPQQGEEDLELNCARKWTALILCGFYADQHSFREFISTVLLSCPKHTLDLVISNLWLL